ncbi:MAG: type II toxin-antitoxin system HicB family antitoxin [Dehalococcoidia bacterium]|nr:type II toxin-antitoxin system HicB family antitoxin [Dehalococcoidia bacterium]
MLKYTVLLRRNEEVPGYSVLVPQLPGCFSQGMTVEEALFNAKEAIECHLEGIAEDREDLPIERESFLIATVSVESPSIAGTLDELFGRLRDDVAARSKCRIEAKALDAKGYSLGAPKIFAHAFKRPRKGALAVTTKREWADKAGASVLADRLSENGYFTWPACHWDLKSVETDSYKRAVTALSKICAIR